MTQSMKIIFGIAAVFVVVLAGLGLYRCFGREHRKGMTGDSKGNPEALDGPYTYVDNDKLLAVIAGSWLSEDGRFELFIQKDGRIFIQRDGKTVREDMLQFSYLQPGYVADTEFGLSAWELTETAGDVVGSICSLHYEAAGDGLIAMKWEKADGSDETVVFKKTKSRDRIPE